MTTRIASSGLLGLGTGSVIAFFFWGRSDQYNNPGQTAVQTDEGRGLGGKPPGGIQVYGTGVNPSGFFKYGFPGPIHDLQNREEFVSCYDRRTRMPYWVVEHVTAASLKNRNGDRKNSFFKEDEIIPDSFRARLKDYFRSGYDRGHMAPAANAKFSQKAMDETFFLTNVCPQIGDGFNRDYWAHFEYFCRTLTNKYHDVRIASGPLFLPKQGADGKFRVSYEVIGNPPSIAVPTHFFKVIVAENSKSKPESGDVAVAAFVLPNEPIPNERKLIDFEVPINAVERSSGLQFLQKLPASRKKNLCEEIDCHIIVREFKKALPPSKSLPVLPPGRS
ncbi:LAMI_0F03092g1_1 [Lachancea mirantina]|uniref:Endonuclease n=1 Tax=Lachancea mirantina TaxID=1230905 RepID=A0A1G4JWZ0_9SACH|nr:LAMI_0F03092g1_1 [Lachancea mirantina]